jgi:Beta-galactosidase/beta-glucuronidase
MIEKNPRHLLMMTVTVLLFSVSSLAQVRLPRLVRDSMILQRDMPVKIWGWASANEKISIRFKNKTYKASADKNGNWQLKLPATPAGGPYTIEIKGKNTITLKEVLFGDVWFCSGQSNMVHQLNIHDVTYAKDIAEANYPMIRQFWIPTLSNMQGPVNDFPTGYWKPAVGDDVRPFSAVAYFFCKKLYDKYKVPMGIINSSVGGPPIEAWTSEEGLKAFPEVINTIQKNKDTAYINNLRSRAAAANRPKQPADKGLAGDVKWYDPAYKPVNWRPINIPGFWEDQGLRDLNGVVWYRREIEVPASMTGQPARIFLGRIVDADELYINGERVGNTTYQYPQRRYHIKPGVLKPGKNLLVVRVTNTWGKGGFVPDKPYCLFAGNDTIDLKGTWHYKVGAVFPPTSGSGGGFNELYQPTALYNAMVAPAFNYTIRGICWYQGEGNVARPGNYDDLMAAMISDWRSKWNLGELPFLYVQLPNFGDYTYLPSESSWAELRESQFNALAVPNTAMAVTIDLGEWNDLHPDNKKDVGERLALAALKLSYKEDIVYSGPLFDTAVISGNQIIISFTHTGSGLITNDGEPLSEFAIAGEDKKFVWAKARIEGDKVIVWSEEISNPKYVRYAWADSPPFPNLYNKEGLPASPFRTDK